LPAPNAAKVRGLLRDYLDQRILFYTTRDDLRLAQIDAVTSQLEAELWSAVQVPAAAQPTLPLKTISSLNHPHICMLHGS
jgi:hypothetical protein